MMTNHYEPKITNFEFIRDINLENENYPPLSVNWFSPEKFNQQEISYYSDIYRCVLRIIQVAVKSHDQSPIAKSHHFLIIIIFNIFIE